ncbi:MAG: Uma2 family endonuclease, partial [Isosphaeraceae bacterium]
MASVTEHRLVTVGEYDRMIDAGIIGEDCQVELWDGCVVSKIPKNPRHRVTTRMTAQALEKVIPLGWYVNKEEALVIGPRSKPEPDVAVIRSEFEFDTSRDPTASDCCLVVEVADSSLDDDRGKKLAGYARAAIPVYWIVNLRENQVEVYTDPNVIAGCYGSRALYRL